MSIPLPGQTRFVPEYSPSARLRDHSAFLEIIRERTEKQIVETNPLEEYLDPEGGWRFRVRENPFSIDRMLACDEMTMGHAEDSIGAAIFQLGKEVQDQQFNGHWELVAWAVEEKPVKRRARTKTERAKLAQQKWNKYSGDPKPSEKEETMIEELRVSWYGVWVDIARMPEMDLWKQKTGLEGGGFSGGNIPPKVLKEYDRARKLIAQYLDWKRGTTPDRIVVKQGLLDAAELELVNDLRENRVTWKATARILSRHRGQVLEPDQVKKAYLEATGGTEEAEPEKASGADATA